MGNMGFEVLIRETFQFFYYRDEFAVCILYGLDCPCLRNIYPLEVQKSSLFDSEGNIIPQYFVYIYHLSFLFMLIFFLQTLFCNPLC